MENKIQLLTKTFENEKIRTVWNADQNYRLSIHLNIYLLRK